MVPEERLRMVLGSQSRETNARGVQIVGMAGKTSGGLRIGTIDSGGLEHVRDSRGLEHVGDSRGLEAVITIQN